MKQSYNIEISGVQLNIVTEDGAEFVRETVDTLEKSVSNMLLIGKNYSKLDALALCALDYCGEFRKAEAKIKNLEAQIEILEANIRRLRDDSAVELAKEPTSVEANPEEEADPSEQDTDCAVAEETEPDEPVNENSDDEGRDAKFRQLEALLGSQLRFDLDKE